MRASIIHYSGCHLGRRLSAHTPPHPTEKRKRKHKKEKKEKQKKMKRKKIIKGVWARPKFAHYKRAICRCYVNLEETHLCWGAFFTSLITVISLSACHDKGKKKWTWYMMVSVKVSGDTRSFLVWPGGWPCTSPAHAFPTYLPFPPPLPPNPQLTSTALPDKARGGAHAGSAWNPWDKKKKLHFTMRASPPSSLRQEQGRTVLLRDPLVTNERPWETKRGERWRKGVPGVRPREG